MTPQQRYREKIKNCPIARAKKKLLNQQRYLNKKAAQPKTVKKPEFNSVAEVDEWYLKHFNMRVGA